MRHGIVVAWLTVLVLPGASAHAAGPTVTVTPIRISALDIPSGSSWSDTLTIANHSVTTASGQISVSPARGVTPPDPRLTVDDDFSGVSALLDRSHGYTSVNLGAWNQLQSRGARLTIRYTGAITPEVLQGYDLLILPEREPTSTAARWTTAEAQTVASWVAAGGSLLMAGGWPDALESYRLLLGVLALDVELSSEPAGTGRTEQFGPHFITEGISAVDLTPTARISRVGGRAVPIVMDADGVPVVAVAPAGAGRVAVAVAPFFWGVGSAANDNYEFAMRLLRWLSRPSWLLAEPVSSWTPPGDSTRIAVNVETAGLDAGDYAGEVLVDFAGLTDVSVPVDLRVAGAGRMAVSPAALDFKDVFVGASAELDLHVINPGSDSLHVTDVTLGPGAFTLAGGPATLGPGEAAVLTITFAPSAPGIFGDDITITSDDPAEATVVVSLTGVGVAPPAWRCSAVARNVALDFGATSEESFVISNDGVSPLVWEALSIPDTNAHGTKPQDMKGLRFAWSENEAIQATVGLIGHLTERGAEVVAVNTNSSGSVLSSYDALGLGYVSGSQSSTFPDGVAAWVRDGGGLLLKKWSPGLTRVLEALGSGISFAPEQETEEERVTSIAAHETTQGVEELFLSADAGSYLELEGAATALVLDGQGRPVVAVEPIGQGQIVVFARGLIADRYVGLSDNRRFGNQVLEWLAGPTWLGTVPRRGVVDPGDSVSVQLAFRAEGLENPAYSGALRFRHNVPAVPADSLPMSLQVNPAPRILVPSAVATDSTVIGGERHVVVTVKNIGTAILQIADVVSDTPEFSVTPTNIGVGPGGSASLTVSFQPQDAGNFAGTITITSNDPHQPESDVAVSGVSYGIPVLRVTGFSYGATLRTGEVAVDTMWVANDGISNLDWSSVSITSHTKAGDSGGPAHLSDVRILYDWRHGRSLSTFSTLRDELIARGADLVARSDSISASTLASFDVLWVDAYSAWAPAEAQAVGDWVANGGSLMLSQARPVEANYLLAASGVDVRVKSGPLADRLVGTVFPHPSTIDVATLDGRVGNPYWCDTDDPTVRTLFTDSLGRPAGMAWERGRTRLVVLTSPLSEVGATTLADNLTFLRSAFDWLAGEWLFTDPGHGTVAPGGEMPVAVRWDASGVSPGSYSGQLELSQRGQVDLVMNAPMTVVSAPRIDVASASVDFGTVFVGFADSALVRVRNSGDVTANVTGIEADQPEFSVVSPATFAIGPGAWSDVVVRVQADGIGAHTATLAIRHDGDGSPAEVTLAANVVTAPVVAVQPSNVFVTVPRGDRTERALEICNGLPDPGPVDTGPVRYGIALERVPPQDGPRHHSEVVDPADRPERVTIRGAGGPDAFGYGWRDSDRAGALPFDWVDIVGTGTPVLLAGDESMSPAIPIGFPFPFYGHEMTDVFVSSNGWLSFESQDAAPSNRPLPSPDAPGNLLAPFWDDLEWGGVYHWSDGERFVVLFDHVQRYGHGAGGPYTFEVILFRDGRFVFQYLDMNGARNRATIGIQDGGGNDGLTVACNAVYIHDGLAVEFWRGPSWIEVWPREGTLSVGECGEAMLSFDTAGLWGGNYDVDVVVTSDDPDDPRVVSRARLHVPGDPAIEVTQGALDFGDVAVGRSAQRSVHLENRGVRRLRVRGLETSQPDYATVPPFDLEPGASAEVPVTFAPSARGTSSGALELRSDDPLRPVVTIALIGRGQDPPILDVTPLSASAELFTEEVAHRTVTIFNAGEADLVWSAAPSFGYERPANRPGGPAEGFAKTGLDISGWSILWPRAHRQPGGSYVTALVADLRARQAKFQERSEAITPGLLAGFDAVWAAPLRSWTDEEAGALANWVVAGGSVLLLGETSSECRALSGLLDAMGVGISYVYEKTTPGWPSRIYPHPTTAGVDSVVASRYAHLVVTGAAAGPLFDDATGHVGGAYGELGLGRIVAIAGKPFYNGTLDYGDDRTFGMQVFEWLAGPTWLSAAPSAGVLAAGQSADVDLVIDSANLPAGPYAGRLVVLGNDEAHPAVMIDAAVDVHRPIFATPRSFSVVLEAGETAVDTLRIENLGAEPLDFAIDVVLASDAAPKAGSSDGTPPAPPLRDLTGQRFFWPRRHGEASATATARNAVLVRGGEWVESTSAFVTAAYLADFDVVVINVPSRDWDPSEADALRDWIRDGGRALCFGGSLRHNALFDVVGSGFRFESISSQTAWLHPEGVHPVTAGIDSVYQASRYVAFGDLPPSVRVLLREGDGTPSAVVTDVGAGRLVALAGDVLRSRFGSAPENTRFGNQLFDWLADSSWLEVEPDWGSIPGGGTAAVAVHVGRGQVAGAHLGELIIRENLVPWPVDTLTVAAAIGAPGELVVDPRSIDVGTVPAGGTATASFELHNVGSADILVSRVTVEPSAYQVDLPSVVLPPAHLRTVNVLFSPDAVGSYPGAIAIFSNDPREPVTRLPLMGHASDPVPDLALTRTTVNFGANDPGNARDDSVTVTNVGALDLVVSGITVAAPFSADTTGFVLPPGGSRRVPVRYKPPGLGPHSRVLSIASNDPDQPTAQVVLAGLGAVGFAEIELSKSSINFGTVVIGTSRTDSLVIVNPGNRDLVVSALLVDPPFTVEPTDCVVGPGGGRVVLVRFAPTGVVLQATVLRIESNAPDDPVVEASLTGSGWLAYSEISVSRTALHFGSVLTGTAVTDTLTVWNQGNSTLFVSVEAMSPPFGVDVPVFEVPRNAKHVVTVSFAPVNGQFYSQLAIVRSNDLDEPEVEVALDGTGYYVPPRIELSASSLDFGTVLAGATAVDTLVVTNGGNGGLVVSGVTLPAPYSADPVALQVPSHESRPLVVTFRPAVVGDFPGTLTIASNDSLNPSVDVGLAGVAAWPPVVTLDPDSLFADLVPGVTHQDTVTVGNEGLGDLQWEMAIKRPLPGGALPAAGARFVRATTELPPSGRRRFAGGEYRDLSGVRILYDRSNGEAAGIKWSTLIADLRSRGAVLIESLSPITAEALGSYDILWVTEGTGWTDEEAAEVAAWYGIGKGLLLEGDHSVTAFNRIVDALGIPAVYVQQTASGGESPFVFPHPVTIGVRSLRSAASARLQPTSPAVVLHTDPADRPLAVASSGGGGRAVLLSDIFLDNPYIDLAGNRRFGNHLFDWLAATASILLEPRAGALSPGGSEPVTVGISAIGVLAGEYSADLALTCNDPVTPAARVALVMSVPGAAETVADPASIDFGSWFSGSIASKRFAVVNAGTDTLHVASVAVSGGTDFTLDGSFSDLPPFAGLAFDVTYVAAAPGSSRADIVILSDDPAEPEMRVPLLGVAVDPPIVGTDPSTYAVDLMPESMRADTLRIMNSGGSSLEWTLRQEEDGHAPPMRFDGLSVLWDQSHGEPGVAGWSTVRYYLGRDGAILSSPPGPMTPELLADFDALWIGNPSSSFTPAERTAVGDWVRAGGCLVLEGDTEFATAEGNELLAAAGAGIAYAAEAGVVGAARNFRPHEILRSIPAINLLSSASYLSTVEPPAHVLFDDAGDRPIAAVARVGDGRVFSCLADVTLQNQRATSAYGIRVFNWLHSWLTVDPIAGVIPAGGSVGVATDFRSFAWGPGAFTRTLVLDSNDPATPQTTVPALLHVFGTPMFVADPESLVFPVPFVGWPTAVALTLSNPGTDTLHIVSALSDHPDFAVNLASTAVAPGESRISEVVLTASAAGDLSATLSISHDAQGSPQSLALRAFPLIEPRIAVTPDTLEATLPPDAQETRTVTICNAPGTPDSALTSPLIWGVRVVEPGAPMSRNTGGPDAFGHYWIDSDEPGGPAFDWVDIRGVGAPMNLQGIGWNRGPFPIGFEFPFYRDVATEFYACGRGWVSFTSRQNALLNLELPCDCPNSPPSLLAPWWDEIFVAGDPGWYHNDGTRLIIQFAEFVRQGPVGGPYDFEVILYPDGRIVYQYLQMVGATNSATIGMQNEARDDGLTISFNEAYMHDGLAVEIRPWPLWLAPSPLGGVLAPGQCADVQVALDTRFAPPGESSRDLRIPSNDPDDPLAGTTVLLHVAAARAATAGPEPAVLPIAFALHNAMPNPFGNTTRIRFDLPRAGFSRIVLYDVSGRTVRTLVAEELPAGRHAVVWDGRDAGGRVAATGVYFYRMTTADYTATRKIVRLR